MKGLLRSFGYAFRGIYTAIRRERNMRIHISFMVYMYYFLLRFDFFILDRTDWALICLANALVLMAELVNTSLEATIDLVEHGYHIKAKIAKDTAAAAVLVGAVFSVVIGILVLGQPEAFRALFAYYRTHIAAFIAFCLSLAVAIIFIFFPGQADETKHQKRK